MRKILIVFFLLFALSTKAQVDRRIGRVPSESQKPKSKSKPDPIALSVEHLKKELNLDGFQEAAVKSLFDDYFKNYKETIELDIADLDKIEKLKTLKQKLDTQIADILNNEQREKFKTIQHKEGKK